MIEAEPFTRGLLEHGFRFLAGVPCSMLAPLINQALDEERLTYLGAANEGDAVAAAAGAAIGGRRAVAMMQNSGLGNAVNPLTSLIGPFHLPLLLLITLRGEAGRGDEPQHAIMGRITGALLDLMEVAWEEFPRDLAAVAGTLARAGRHLDGGQRPYALVVRAGALAPRPPAASGAFPDRGRRPGPVEMVGPAEGASPTRGAALRRIIERTPEQDTVVIATTGYTGRELLSIADRPNHLYMVGSMGCASSLGLGLSLARPDLQVVVVDGDGAALMRMGNLATIGACGRSNLTHLILDNGAHESTGGQPTVSPGLSFAAVAAACGYARSLEGRDLALIDALFDAPDVGGPRLGHLRTALGTPRGLPRPALAPHELLGRLKEHLARAGTAREPAAGAFTSGPAR